MAHRFLSAFACLSGFAAARPFRLSLSSRAATSITRTTTLSGAAIAAIVVGTIVLLAMCAGIITYIISQRRRRRQTRSQAPSRSDTASFGPSIPLKDPQSACTSAPASADLEAREFAEATGEKILFEPPTRSSRTSLPRLDTSVGDKVLAAKRAQQKREEYRAQLEERLRLQEKPAPSHEEQRRKMTMPRPTTRAWSPSELPT